MELVIVEKAQRRETGYRLLSEGLSAWFLSAGMLLIWNRVLETECPAELLLGISLLVVLLCELIPWKYFAPVCAMGVAGITAVAAFAGLPNVSDGLIGLNNSAATAIGEHTGWILPQYVLQNEQTIGTNVSLVMGLLAVVMALLAFGMVRGKRMWIMAPVLIIVLLPTTLTERSIGYSGAVLIVIGVLGAAASHIYKDTWKMAWILSVALICLAAVGTGVAMRIWPADSYSKSAITKVLQKNTKDLIQQIRYEKKEINSLPKGDFTKVGSREATEDIALSVTMSEPESYYLKGFVGSTCTADGWEKLSAKEYFDCHDLFYWLHQDLFYGNAQMDLADLQLNQTENGKKENTIKIENKLADSEYLYTPYEVKGRTLNQTALSNNADETWRSEKLFGTRSYEYQADTDLVTQFPELAAQIFLKSEQDENAPYVAEESYYNTFVYEHYTELSKMQESLLEKELGFAGDQKNGHIDYYSAIRKVEDYLESEITYDENCGSIPENRSFLNYFLTESRKGYDVHYATAATLMFRYYGIPARYVEGYLITPDDIQNAKPDEAIDIPAGNGHAWTEIYIDGLGWVPIEVTPKYREIMKQPDLTRGLEAGTTQAKQTPQKQNQSAPEEEKTLPQLLRETMIDLLKVLLLLMLAFDLFVILFILVVTGRRIVANSRRKRQFRSRDHRTAVKRMMGYASELLLYSYPKLAGCSETEIEEQLEKIGSQTLREQYHKAYAAGQKATFSRHDISEKERTEVAQYMEALKKILLNQAGWYGRWVLRYIERLC